MNNRFDAKSIISCKQQFTLDLFRQCQCRQTIVSVIKAIKLPESRVEFGQRKMQKVLEAAMEGGHENWTKIERMTLPYSAPNNADADFMDNITKLYDILANGKRIRLSMEENELIAKAILQDRTDTPLVIPNARTVCKYCSQVDNSIDCQDHVCHKCMSVLNKGKVPVMDWTRFEKDNTNCKSSNKQSGRRTRRSYFSPEDVCTNCTDNNNNNAMPTTTTNIRPKCGCCKQPISLIHICMTCIQCDKPFHATSNCIVAGTILLTQTKLICHSHIDSAIKRNKIQLPCSICCGERKDRSIQCAKCPNRFHERCHPKRNATKCGECEERARHHRHRHRMHSNENYVMLKAMKSDNSIQWWPSIMISTQQLPKEVTPKLCQPGKTFVFIIGKNVYQQVYVRDLLPLNIKNPIARNALCPAHVSALNEANKVADKICREPV